MEQPASSRLPRIWLSRLSLLFPCPPWVVVAPVKASIGASIGLAGCATNGGLNDSQTAWEIAMTSSIEDLDLLDGQVKADRIVARLVLQQDLHSDQPHIVALGSHIVNLRISGSAVGVELDPLTLTQFNSYDVLARAAVVGKSTRKVSEPPLKKVEMLSKAHATSVQQARAGNSGN